jgi:CubicO group peptidase (beta-lactamase class C family)
MISSHWSRAIRVLLPAALPVAALPVWADTPSASPALTAALQPFVDQGTLAGAVTLVADRDRVLSLNAAGYADIAAKEPMRADTLFWIASQSKPITATARMLLVDEGKVNLDDPVARHLPELYLISAPGAESCFLRNFTVPSLSGWRWPDGSTT